MKKKVTETECKHEWVPCEWKEWSYDYSHDEEETVYKKVTDVYCKFCLKKRFLK